MIKKVTFYLFPCLIAFFAILYFVDEPFYRLLISEDHAVEWLTFAMLFIAGACSAILSFKIKHRYHYYHWFFILFSIFCICAGGEEISWGQRVWGIESTEFFHRYSDQDEINIHNTFQGIFHIKTKHIALLVMLVYGVILPWLESKGKLNDKWLAGKNRFFIIPPSFLIPAFFIGTVLMLDFQTGYEEELGEMTFSICFLLMVAWNYTVFEAEDRFEATQMLLKSKPSFKANRDMPIRGKFSVPRI